MLARDKFDRTSPCLVIAPHLKYPTRNGADILIDKKWSHFSEYVPFVDIVGNEVVARYEQGKLVKESPHENVQVSKARAAFGTLSGGSHYLLEKFLTREFVGTARPYLLDSRYRTVIFSYVWTASMVQELPEMKNRLYCVETHNDELKWYRDLRRYSLNPLIKLTSYSSERWAQAFLDMHGSEFFFLHVSEADQKGFLERFPDLRSHVVPIGVDEPAHDLSPVEDLTVPDKIRLIFVGSLNVKMNFDAIKLFRSRFYPILKDRLGGNVEVLVVGSNPSEGITKLCKSMGWRLHSNVSEQELEDLYRISTFSILPFSYSTGSKLKLLNSLSHGVPYLATLELREQAEELYPCLVSSEPDEWLDRIREIEKRGITSEHRSALKDYARKYSWKSIAHYTFQILTDNYSRGAQSNASPQ